MMKKGKIIDNGTCKELIKKHGRNNLKIHFLNWSGVKMNYNKIYALGLDIFI